MSNSEFEDLLNQLSTEEGKARAVYRGVRRGLKIRTEFIDGAIQTFEDSRWFEEAAVLSNVQGNVKRALANYLKHDQPYPVQDVTRRRTIYVLYRANEIRVLEEGIGDPKTIDEVYDSAISDLEKAGMCRNAAELALVHGDEVRALKNYEDGENFSSALSLARDLKNKEMIDKFLAKYEEKERDLKEKTERNHALSEIARSLGNTERAIEYWEKTPYSHKAAKIAWEIGNIEKAKQLYRKHIDEIERWKVHFEKAAELCEKIGDFERAMIDYEKAGRFESAKLVAESMENTKMAKIYKTLLDILNISSEQSKDKEN